MNVHGHALACPCVQPPAMAVKVKKVKKKEITIIDGKRAFNLNISLARFRMTFEEIRGIWTDVDR